MVEIWYGLWKPRTRHGILMQSPFLIEVNLSPTTNKERISGRELYFNPRSPLASSSTLNWEQKMKNFVLSLLGKTFWVAPCVVKRFSQEKSRNVINFEEETRNHSPVFVWSKEFYVSSCDDSLPRSDENEFHSCAEKENFKLQVAKSLKIEFPAWHCERFHLSTALLMQLKT